MQRKKRGWVAAAGATKKVCGWETLYLVQSRMRAVRLRGSIRLSVRRGVLCCGEGCGWVFGGVDGQEEEEEGGVGCTYQGRRRTCRP